MYSCERQDGKKFAVKILRNDAGLDDSAGDLNNNDDSSGIKQNERMRREVQLLKRFKGHANIIELEESFKFEHRMYFVMPRMQFTLMQVSVLMHYIDIDKFLITSMLMYLCS